ncbi:MAG: MerR family transcriptional regulator [Gammaproteobacteria bacterium]|nr:MerR family transcriptional regulator [Gammaproteobacteria bacterium]MBQ0840068.1 MerR family transcriptional regulator [Gammaproteobacteria bacterium]
MNISEAAKLSGLSAKTIRYYESIELLSQPRRAGNGYRSYHHGDIKTLCFLRQARQFGFNIAQCRLLLGLYKNPQRRSGEVHQLVSDKLEEVDAHIRELGETRDLLASLVGACSNNDEPDCAIIDSLADPREQVESQCLTENDR